MIFAIIIGTFTLAYGVAFAPYMKFLNADIKWLNTSAQIDYEIYKAKERMILKQGAEKEKRK